MSIPDSEPPAHPGARASILFQAGGYAEEVRPKDGRQFTLEEAQRIVDGPVQVIWIAGGWMSQSKP